MIELVLDAFLLWFWSVVQPKTNPCVLESVTDILRLRQLTSSCPSSLWRSRWSLRQFVAMSFSLQANTTAGATLEAKRLFYKSDKDAYHQDLEREHFSS